MHMSPEELERYIAQQDAELAAQSPSIKPEPARKAVATGGFPMSLLLFSVTFFLVFGLTFVCWNSTTKMSASKRSSTWDQILGFSAKVSNRRYDPNANSLTERFTLRKK